MVDSKSISVRVIPLTELSSEDLILLEHISRYSKPISAFQSKHWIESVRSFASNRSGCLLIYTDGKPSGYLLFDMHRNRVGLKYLKSPASPALTPYGGLVLTKECESHAECIIARIGAVLSCKYSYILGNPFMSLSGKTHSKFELKYAETSMIDLKMSDEELFMNLHSKTRNMIRKGQKSDIHVADEGRTAIPVFLEMLESTLKGTGIDIPPTGFLQRLCSSSNSFISVLIARCKGKPISGVVILHYQGTSYYWLGASFQEGRKNGSNELIQWKAIQLAKRAGNIRYDMVRIDRDRLPGIARFKLRFGGEICKFPVLTWRSDLWQFLRSARRICTFWNASI